jgi:hypothetical protein
MPAVLAIAIDEAPATVTGIRNPVALRLNCCAAAEGVDRIAQLLPLITRGLSPLDPAKGKRTKRKASVDVLGETKTDEVDPVVGGGRDAVR